MGTSQPRYEGIFSDVLAVFEGRAFPLEYNNLTSTLQMDNCNFYYQYPMYWPQQPMVFPYHLPFNYDQIIPIEQHLPKVKQEPSVQDHKHEHLEAPSDQTNKPAVSPLKEAVKQKAEKKMVFQKESQQYRPNQKKRKGRAEKFYEKDQNRNIMPNTINKIFSFLRSKSKSNQTLKLLFQLLPHLQKKCSSKKYYIYQNFIKSRMNKFIMEDNIGILFQIVDHDNTIFTEEEQISFIEINIALLLYYLRKPSFYLSLVGSPRVGKDKIIEYLTIIRRIRCSVELKAEQFKLKYSPSV